MTPAKDLRDACLAGRRLEAVKILRRDFGLSFEAARDAAEEVLSRQGLGWVCDKLALDRLFHRLTTASSQRERESEDAAMGSELDPMAASSDPIRITCMPTAFMIPEGAYVPGPLRLWTGAVEGGGPVELLVARVRADDEKTWARLETVLSAYPGPGSTAAILLRLNRLTEDIETEADRRGLVTAALQTFSAMQRGVRAFSFVHPSAFVNMGDVSPRERIEILCAWLFFTLDELERHPDWEDPELPST